MAKFGLKKLYWAPMETEPETAVPTYGDGVTLGKAVSVSVTVNNSEASLYADDALAEYLAEFMSGDFTAEADNITLDSMAKLYGATLINGELQCNAGDTAPYGGISGYQVLMVNSVKKYRAYFFPKMKAAIPDFTGNTKGESASFATEPVKGKIMAPNFGPWKATKEFDNETAADAWCQQKLGVATWHNMNVMVTGAGTGEGATPEGVTAVADGEDFVLTITGTATKLYDNGEDKTTAISGGAYTVEEVDADHQIAVVF